MRIEATRVQGLYLLEPQKFEDDRGYFATSFSTTGFEKLGLCNRFAQANVVQNYRKGTLRGLHFQLPPHSEVKLVRCSRGRIFDVGVDLRPDSPSFLQWVGVELKEGDLRLMYVPDGCAHGYLTLEDATEVSYQVSALYAPASATGCRWDDPLFGVEWPEPPQIILDRDAAYPLATPGSFEVFRGLKPGHAVSL